MLPQFISFVRWLLAATLLGVGQAVFAAQVVLQLPPEAEGLESKLSRASLSLQTTQQEDVTTQDILAAARADYARMTGALYEVGRYGGVVSIRVDGREAADMPPFAAPTQIRQIEIRVEPGPLFTFANTRIAPLAPGKRLPSTLAPGAPAFSGTVGDAVGDAADDWRDVGHAKVAIASQRITANHAGARLSAEITLAPGPRLTFGQLVVARPGKVRPERVREIAGLPTGQVYSLGEVQDASRRLRRTGAFSSVVLEDAEQIGPGNTLDVIATLADAKPRRFGFGAEISSLEGLTLSGFWLHRNLLGGAERLRIEGEVSGIGGDSGGTDYIFSTRFERPATFTADTDLFFSARVQDLDEPDFGERSVRVVGGLAHILSETLSGEISLAYQYSDVRDNLGTRTLEHILVPAKLTYDTRDNALNARRGAFFELNVTPFAGLNNGALGARFLFDARGYRTFGKAQGLTFATRAQIGTINGASLTEVPPDMLFFSGGAGTVRGQSYQSLGIPLPGGLLQVGGRSFAALSAELRAKVKDKWSIVGFADAGFVGSDSWWDERGNTHYGAGFGVRYDTGLGPIRVDIGTPLGSNAGNGIELYVGIGQAF